MLQSQLIDITHLEPNKGQIEGLPSNPRFIKDEAFKSLVRSLQEDPEMLDLREVIAYPLAKNRYVVLGGNQRLMAGLELRFTEMPVKVVPQDTPLEKLKRIVIKDNGSWGNHDWDLLANEWSDLPLQDWGIDLPEDWLQEPETLPAEEEDFNAEPPAEPITVLGDLYELNGHRVLCGDSTDSDCVARLMDGKKADMVFTDPPYGVSYQSNMREKSDKFAVLENDENFILEWVPNVHLFSKGFVFVWTSWKVLSRWIEICEPIGDLSNMIIWDKGGGGIGDLEKTFSTDFEVALVYHRGSKLTGKRIGSVWSINKDNPNTYLHPTMKPVELAVQAITHTTNPKECVLDLFLGSGTTLLGAEQTNRICYAMELTGQYCDVIVRRWVKYMRDNSRPYTVKRNGKTLTEAEINQYFPE